MPQVTKFNVIRTGEFGNIRSPTAFDCCKNGIKHEADRVAKLVQNGHKPSKDWDKFEEEGDPRLKMKGPLVCKVRHHVYVCDDAAERDRRINDGDGFDANLIVLTNRSTCDEVSGCKGSKSCWATESLPKFVAKDPEQPNRSTLTMKFMPCMCTTCRRHKEILHWEREHQDTWESQDPLPHARPGPCPFEDDLASAARPPPSDPLEDDAAQAAVSRFRRKMYGVCTWKSHQRVDDADLYEYIHSTREGGEYKLNGDLVKMQCRCRGLGVTGRKAILIYKIYSYLQKENLLPANAIWPHLTAEEENEANGNGNPAYNPVVLAGVAQPNPVAMAALQAAGLVEAQSDDEDDD